MFCARLLDYAENGRHLVIGLQGSKSQKFHLDFGIVFLVFFPCPLVWICKSVFLVHIHRRTIQYFLYCYWLHWNTKWGERWCFSTLEIWVSSLLDTNQIAMMRSSCSTLVCPKPSLLKKILGAVSSFGPVGTH